MRILVTGGMGFIGSNYIRRTLRSNPEYSVINLDKLGLGSNHNNLHDINSPNYKFIQGDITKSDTVNDIVSKVDTVVNFAAETHVDRSIKDPKEFINNNILGTYQLLEAERRIDHPIRHIQVSTDEVYGDIIEGSFTENSPLNPSNPYSATKASADMLCHAYHKTYDMNITVTRCTNNFGPYQFPEKLIPKTIIRAINNLKIPVYGTGENIRDWLYVIDHCDAINRVLENGTPGEIYNISSGNEISVIQIVSTILETLRKPESLIEHVQDRPGHDIRYSLDSNKLRTDLNWKPIYSLQDSLVNTIRWYKENQNWWEPIISKEVLSPIPWKK